ncbi:hypothetical protein GCM10010985_36060 [Caballeronia grimmiae]|uniref:DUF3592 domain-containing protein n=2 Tax=Caballeronia grimmiae TaxID=1071679 RepID=A0ABQ1RT08_9BURK|nr:hypothetical protein GCM10010985_36060 [Caballeronia grimmiae]
MSFLRKRKYNGSALVLGLLGLMLTLALLWWRVSFFLSSTVVLGEVVHLNTPSGYHADVKFTTREDETIIIATGPGYPVDVGDRLEVRYVPSDPHAEATLNQFSSLWEPVLIPGAVTIAALLAAFFNLPLQQKGR